MSGRVILLAGLAAIVCACERRAAEVLSKPVAGTMTSVPEQQPPMLTATPAMILPPSDAVRPPNTGSLSTHTVRYLCDEGSGSTVADSNGNNLPLILHGGLGFTAGQQGSALRFPDSAAFFASRERDDEIFNFGDRDFAIELHCRFEAFAHEQVLVEKFSGRSGPGWTLTLLDAGRLQFFTQGAGEFNAPVRLQQNQWHRIAVFRRGPRIRMFVDQSLVLDQFFRGPIVSSPNPLLVGRRTDEDGRDFPLNGAIDDLRIEVGPVNATGNDSAINPAGTNTGQPITAGSGDFRGRYTVGFETSEFIPCGKEERWWITGNMSAINAKLQAVPRGTMQRLFVQVTGQLTPPGRYGHLGRYQRKLTVDRVVLARELRPDDCR